MKKAIIIYGYVFTLSLIALLIFYISQKYGLIEDFIFKAASILITIYFVIYTIVTTILLFILKRPFFVSIIGIGLTIILAGFQFKLFHWPYGKIMFIIGNLISGFFMTVYLMKQYRTKTKLNDS